MTEKGEKLLSDEKYFKEFFCEDAGVYGDGIVSLDLGDCANKCAYHTYRLQLVEPIRLKTPAYTCCEDRTCHHCQFWFKQIPTPPVVFRVRADDLLEETRCEVDVRSAGYYVPGGSPVESLKVRGRTWVLSTNGDWYLCGILGGGDT